MKTHRKPLSSKFPAYHTKREENTFFVEKLLNQIGIDYEAYDYIDLLIKLNPDKDEQLLVQFATSLTPCLEFKGHTIRAGNKVKAGDFLKLYVWSGKPYQSKQIVIAPDIEIKKVFDFKIDEYGTISSEIIGTKGYYDIIGQVAKNDGLDLGDFEGWFKLNKPKPIAPFVGQIICWSKNINY
jgi:hypothetical protein